MWTTANTNKQWTFIMWCMLYLEKQLNDIIRSSNTNTSVVVAPVTVRTFLKHYLIKMVRSDMDEDSSRKISWYNNCNCISWITFGLVCVSASEDVMNNKTIFDCFFFRHTSESLRSRFGDGDLATPFDFLASAFLSVGLRLRLLAAEPLLKGIAR